MKGSDGQRLVAALMLLTTALFVASGAAGAGRWRRHLRTAAILGFVLACAIALGIVAAWLAGLPLGH